MTVAARPELVEQTIVEAIRDLGVEHEEISRRSSLAEMDVDSLDLIELSQTLEDELGVKLGGEAITNCETVGDLVDVVSGRGR